MELEEKDIQITRPEKLHLIHWLVVILSALLTIGAWYFSKKQLDEKTQDRFLKEADQVIELVSERMQKYEDALWSGVSAIQSNNGNTNSKKWRTFSEFLKVEQKYPGINGIGVIYNIDKKNIKNFLTNQRKQRSQFKIFPKHQESEYWPITYIEPVEQNNAAVGLDMAHEKNRFTAAKKSRDSGLAQITGPIELVQDSEKTPGFLLYVPFYKGDSSSLENRRKNIIGLVYAPFVFKKLMKGTLEKDKRHVDIMIKDGDDILYNEHQVSNLDFDSNPLFKKEYTVNLYGRKWKFDIWSAKSFNHASNSNQPLFILLGGIVIDLLLLTLFIILSRSNKRAYKIAKRATSEYEKKNEELTNINVEMNKEIQIRRRAEKKAELASNVKSEFLANMSHEIRTPMNGVISCTNLLIENCKDTEDLKYLKAIQYSGKTLLRVINDILDFSKLEAGKVEIESYPFNLRESLKHIMSLFENKASQEGKIILLDIEPNIPEVLDGDESRIKQVLNNLISNALKFAASEIKVSIKRATSKDNIKLIFSITDDGIGIPKESWNKLFDSFSQVDASTTRKYGGTGLGLAICKGLVNSMNGEIWVESKQNAGSTFSFTVEMNETSANVKEDRVQKIAYASNEMASNDLKILIAEDNKINQMIIIRLLQKLGYQPFVVENGREAIEFLESNSVDIILMDKHMPILDGVAATKEIVSKWGKKRPYIVALTASVMKKDEEECLGSGMDAFLTKPLELQKLVSAFNDYVGANLNKNGVNTLSSKTEFKKNKLVNVSALNNNINGDSDFIVNIINLENKITKLVTSLRESIQLKEKEGSSNLCHNLQELFKEVCNDKSLITQTHHMQKSLSNENFNTAIIQLTKIEDSLLSFQSELSHLKLFSNAS